MYVSERNESGNGRDQKSKTAHRGDRGHDQGTFERKVITYLEETEECQTTDKKGNPILKFIGNSRKATYSWSSRETVDKEKVKELLDNEDYEKVKKVSTFQVLRIS